MKNTTKNMLIVTISMLAVIMFGCKGPAQAPNLDPAPTITVDMVEVDAAAPVVVPAADAAVDATPDASPDATPDASAD